MTHPYTRLYRSTTTPAVSDDNTLGYEIGDIIVDQVANQSYQAFDVSTGAAVWEELTGGGGGSGDVVGPASAVDDRIATFDGTTGKLIQDSGATVASLNTGVQINAAAAESSIDNADPIGFWDASASLLKKIFWSDFLAHLATDLTGIFAEWGEFIVHNHDGVIDTAKLAQANTHQSPDTDSGPTSLHHTIGAGANQAAAGNHAHKLTDNRTYYVRTDGSDSNTGLVDSAGGAFLTIQKAVDVVSALDIAGFVVTIQVRDGTYTGAVTLKNVTGFSAVGNLVIQGNSVTPTNVVISTTSANCFSATNLSSVWDLKNMQLTTTTSGRCINASNSTVRFSGIDFSTCASHHLYAVGGGYIIETGNYTISGNAVTHVSADGKSIIENRGFTVTISGTPAFSFAFAAINYLSFFYNDFTTYSGSATGTRYYVSLNSAIYTNGAETYLPGNALGQMVSGGKYNTLLGQTRASAQFDKTNTTLANITGLTSTLLAGRTYKFRAVLHTTSNVASGVKFAIAGTCTATAIIYEALVYNAGALAAQTRATALATAVGGVTAVTVALCIIEGVITVNAAGTLTVQFADNAGTNTSSVLIGSTLSVDDVT